MISQLCFAAIAGGILYSFAVFAVRKWKLRAFPGPLAFPIVGNLWDPEAPRIITYLRKQCKIQGKMLVSKFPFNLFNF